MKMEHTVLAPRAGVVRSFRFEPGDQVSEGDELVELEGGEG
jgi:3-methylcrotonyl-CoA carboxylase alpha subunit